MPTTRRAQRGAVIVAVVVVAATAEVRGTGWEEAVAAFEAKRFSEAADGFSAVVEASPDAPEGHYMLGRSLLELGRGADAVASFAAARERGGSLPRYDLALARAQLAVGDASGALATLGPGVPRSWPARELGLWGALLAGAATRAAGPGRIARLEAAVAALPELPALWEALGSLRGEAGDAAGAFAALAKVASLRPHDAALGRRAVQAGFAAAELMPPDERRAAFYRQVAGVAEGLAEEASATEHLVLAGEARLAAGDLEQARRWSEAAAAAEPAAALPRFDLGRIALAAGDDAAARSWLSQARARAGDDAALLRRIDHSMARALHLGGDFRAAAAAYRRAGEGAAAEAMDRAAEAADARAVYEAERSRCLAKQAEVDRLLAEAATVVVAADREALAAEARRALADCAPFLGEAP